MIYLLCLSTDSLSLLPRSGHRTQAWKISPSPPSGNRETRNAKHAGLALRQENYVTCFPPRVLGLDVINSMVTCAVCRVRTHLNAQTVPPTPGLLCSQQLMVTFCHLYLPLFASVFIGSSLLLFLPSFAAFSSPLFFLPMPFLFSPLG